MYEVIVFDPKTHFHSVKVEALPDLIAALVEVPKAWTISKVRTEEEELYYNAELTKALL